jgi:hypothetical protein
MFVSKRLLCNAHSPYFHWCMLLAHVSLKALADSDVGLVARDVKLRRRLGRIPADNSSAKGDQHSDMM